MDATIIATVVSLIGVLAVGVIVPVFLVQRSERIRQADILEAARLHREDRDAEWARQDEVARRAEQAAKDLAASQERIAKQAAEAAALLLEKQDQTTSAQERVARQAAKAAELLLARQEESAAAQEAVAQQAREAARLLAANNALVAETARETGLKLDTIHTLVNSNMTAAMQAEFDAVTRELAMMREVMELRKAGGQQPSTDVLGAIQATEAKLHELDAALADRAKAQDRVNQKTGLDIITTTHYRHQQEGPEELKERLAEDAEAGESG